MKHSPVFYDFNWCYRTEIVGGSMQGLQEYKYDSELRRQTLHVQ